MLPSVEYYSVLIHIKTFILLSRLQIYKQNTEESEKTTLKKRLKWRGILVVFQRESNGQSPLILLRIL
jgi:hypothetical protein